MRQRAARHVGQHPTERVFHETASGSLRGHDRLAAALGAMRARDVLVVVKLRRPLDACRLLAFGGFDVGQAIKVEAGRRAS